MMHKPWATGQAFPVPMWCMLQHNTVPAVDRLSHKVCRAHKFADDSIEF